MEETEIEKLQSAFWTFRETISDCVVLNVGTKSLIYQLLQIILGILKDIYK